MSWKEKIEKRFRIFMGDGKEFFPQWTNATQAVAYNISQFNFPNVRGTLVKRNEAKGRTFVVKMFFQGFNEQGIDHLDVRDDFLKSADDKRHWHIIHPFLGDLRVQPTSIDVDNTKLNVTEITCNVIETILGVFPEGLIVPEDKISEDKFASDELGAISYGNSNPAPDGSDINLFNETINQTEASVGNAISDDALFSDFRNILNEARVTASNATTDVLAAIRSTQELLNFPFRIEQSISAKLKLVGDEFNTLVTSFFNVPITLLNKAKKAYFETTGSSFMSVMCQISSEPFDDNDYRNSNDVISVIDLLLSRYNLFLEQLDSLQSENGEDPGSFIPDAAGMQSLNELVNFTLSRLFEIAFEARQERVIQLESDSSIVTLTHRFYGLDVDDNNLNEFIRNNNVGLKEHLEIKKGRKIIYFV